MSGGGGEETTTVPPDRYQARWSGRRLEEAAAWQEDRNPPDEYRLQLWPADGEGHVRELKRSRLYDA